ncbi:ATP-dependent helicase [Termitidicoccus mucosus]
MATLIPTQGLAEFTSHRGSPIRANAGAGSGKTTAIVERVAALLESAVPPHCLLIMTFSRKASENLRQRIRLKVGKAGEDITIGTFHAVAVREIRNLRETSGEKPHILDTNDSVDLWEQAFDEIPSLPPESFADNLEQMLQSIKPPQTPPDPKKYWKSTLKKLGGFLHDLRSEQINQNLGGENFGDFAVPRLLEKSELAGFMAFWLDLNAWADEGLTNYERLKTEQNCLDYDDTLARWAHALHHDASYRNAIHLRYQHVLIDEYQDTNYLQEHIIQGLNCANLTVVGDPSQCIYAFRKSVPRPMVEFHRRYDNVKEIALETNFRSKDEILDVCNHVLKTHDDLIRQDARSPMARLVLKGVHGKGGAVQRLQFAGSQDENLALLNWVKHRLRQGAAPSDLIILARTSYYLSPLEILLRSENIPVQIWGGNSLMESKTMKDVTAFLKIALRPSQPSNFKRLARLIIGGERKHDEMFLRWKMGVAALEGTEGFMGTVKRLAAWAAEEKHTPEASRAATIVTTAIDNLKKYISPDLEKLPFKEKKEFEAIEMALREVMQKIRDENPGAPLKLAEVITRLSLDPATLQSSGKKVTLSTIHQAKGLEWEHVLVAGCHEGKLTFFKNGGRTSREETEEECRLLYVACTRARQSLTLTHVNEPVRFLRACPLKVSLPEKNQNIQNPRP